MSDAPERITVTIDDGSLFLEGEPTDEMIGQFWGHVEYVRADLFAELEARLQPHKAGRTNTAEMARAMYQKQSEYVGPQHEEECVRMLTLAFDSFEDRIAELEAENERLSIARKHWQKYDTLIENQRLREVLKGYIRHVAYWKGDDFLGPAIHPDIENNLGENWGFLVALADEASKKEQAE